MIMHKDQQGRECAISFRTWICKEIYSGFSLKGTEGAVVFYIPAISEESCTTDINCEKLHK